MGMIMSCISNIMYLSEKITLWVTCVGLISCIVITFLVTLGMGIGLGYNYCFVDMKTRYKYVPGHYVYPGSPRWPHRSGDEAAGGALRPDQPAEPQVEETTLSEDDVLRTPATFPEEIKIINRPYSPAYGVGRPQFLSKNVSGVPHVPPLNSTDEEETEKTMPMFPMSEHVTDSLPDYSMDSSTEFNATIDDVTTTFSTDTVESVETMEPITDDGEMHYDTNGDPIDPRPRPTLGEDPTNRRVKKLVIPISGGDLVGLLAKLKAENKNYSLQIVTT